MEKIFSYISVFSHTSYAQNNSFIIQIAMLCLRVITPQIFYDMISTLHQNVTMGPGRHIILSLLSYKKKFSFTSVDL